jgi:hypothetical protein
MVLFWLLIPLTVQVAESNDKTRTVTLALAAGGCPTLTVNISGNASFCAGSNTTLTASGGTTYAWSNGTNVANTTVSSAGTYTVTATDANGCTGTASRVVTVNPSPNVTATATQPTCGLSNGSISVTPAGGTYTWTGGLSGSNPTNVAAGTYTVTVTSGGCSATASVTLNTSSGITATATATQPTCGLSNGSISVTPTGATYAWTGGLSGENPTNVAAGTYTVTVTSGGCSATASVTLNTSSGITASATPTQPTCGLSNGSISVTPTGGTYAWTGGLSGENPTNVASGTYTVTVTLGGCSSTASTTLNTSSALTATATPTQLSCGLSNGSISVTPTGATYAWTGGLSGANPTNVAAGTYTVTVTLGGCSATASVTLNTSSGITASATPTQPTCGLSNGSISVTPTGGTYAWTGGLSGENPTNVAAGTYTVTVTSGGCSSTASVTLNTSSGITASTTPTQPTCGLSNGSISVTPTGATYTWTGGLSGENPTNVAAGTYTVTVTSGGCSSTASVTLNTSSGITASTTPTQPTCGLSNGSISVTPTGGTYAWTGGLSGSNPTNVAAGTYTVTVTSGGCSSTTSATLNTSSGITAAATATQPSCGLSNGSISVTPAGGTYTWTGGLSGSNPANVAAGTYTVTVTSGGCSATASVTLNTSSGATATAGGGGNVCVGSDINLTATGGVSYNWSGAGITASTQNQQNPSIAGATVGMSGSYVVTVTNGDGCTATASTAVTVAACACPNPATIAAPSSVAVCAGSSANLSVTLGGGATSATWATSGSGTFNVTTGINVVYTPSAADIAAGSVTINITTNDPDGTSTQCEAALGSIIVNINALPTPSITGNFSICEGETSTLNAGTGFAQYTWSTGDDTQTISITATETATVTVTDANGCAGQASVSVAVNANPTITITGNTDGCLGSTAVLTAAGGSSYVWSDGLGTGAVVTVIPTTTTTYAVTSVNENGCSTVQSITVVVNALPQISVATACNGAVAQATVSTISGNPTAYSLDGGMMQAASVFADIANGNHSITATDANGCSATENFATNCTEGCPTITVSGSSTLCAGASATYTQTGSDIGGTWFVTPAAAGTIDNNGNFVSSSTFAGNANIVFTDNSELGCNGLAAITINAASSPTFTAIAAICEGSEAPILPTASLEGITGSWLPNVVSNTTSGTYTFTPNAACATSTTLSVTVNARPQVILTDECNGSVGQITIIPIAGNPTSYSLDGGATQTIPIFEGVLNGLHSIVISNDAGCSIIENITTNCGTECPTIVPTIVGNTVICEGTSTTLSAEAGFANYAWSNAQITQAITVSQSGTYTVTVTNTDGCTGINNTTVTVNANPVPTIAGNTTICEGTTSTLDAGEGYANYVWSTDETTQTIVVDASNAYAVTVTDTNGCVGSAEATITVLAANDPACQSGEVAPIAENVSASAAVNVGSLIIQLSEYTSDANGDALTYNVLQPDQGGSLTFDATTGAVNIIVDNGFSGLMTIEYSVSDGTFTSTANIVVLVQSVVAVNLVRLSGKAQNNGNLIEWTTANEINNDYFTLYGSTDGTNYNQIATVKGVGNSTTSQNYQMLDKNAANGLTYYRLTQTDYDGTTKQLGVVTVSRNATVFVSTIEPNPASNLVSLSFDSPKVAIATLLVHDAAGKLVYTQQLNTTSGNNMLTLDVSNYAVGTYFVTINTPNGTSTAKLLKK